MMITLKYAQNNSMTIINIFQYTLKSRTIKHLKLLLPLVYFNTIKSFAVFKIH